MIGFGALYLSVCMMAACWYSMRRTRHWLASSTITQGKVVSLRKGGIDTDSNRVTYFPTIVFQSAAGQRIEFESGLGTPLQAYKIGQPVVVRYQSTRPGDARINELSSLWLTSIITGSISFWALLAGLVFTLTDIDV